MTPEHKEQIREREIRFEVVHDLLNKSVKCNCVFDRGHEEGCDIVKAKESHDYLRNQEHQTEALLADNDELEKRLNDLRQFVAAECALCDRSSHSWQPDQSAGITNPQASYRAGMWYAYRQVENKLGPITKL